jgi:hypothetical protein
MRERALSKKQAEALLHALDHEGLALRFRLLQSLAYLANLEVCDWPQAVNTAALLGAWTTSRTERLINHDQLALEELAIELSEMRRIVRNTHTGPIAR